MFKVNAMFTGGKNYVTAIPPHILAKISKYKLDNGHKSTCPIAQRRFNVAHCRKIAIGNAEAFDKGIHLPHSVMICINSSKLLKISKSGKITLLLPETDEEIKKYADMIEVVDGQHRIMSFYDEYRKCDTPENYKLGVTVLDCPTDEEKIYYFKILNTGAKTPDKDLICQHSRKLGDAKNDQEFQHIYDLLMYLNSHQSRLRGSIRTGNCECGGKLISIASLCNSHLTGGKGVKLDDALISMNCKTTEKKADMMEKYLWAWNDAFADGANRFNANDKKNRYASKSYSIFALQFAAPVFEMLALHNNKRWNSAIVSDMFKILKNILGVNADISEKKLENSGAADRNKLAHDIEVKFKPLAEAYFVNRVTKVTKVNKTTGVAVINDPINTANNSVKRNAKNMLKAKV